MRQPIQQRRLMLIVFCAAGFLLFGAVLDTNPFPFLFGLHLTWARQQQSPKHYRVRDRKYSRGHQDLRTQLSSSSPSL
jgi:hypothetical protein